MIFFRYVRAAPFVRAWVQSQRAGFCTFQGIQQKKAQRKVCAVLPRVIGKFEQVEGVNDSVTQYIAPQGKNASGRGGSGIIMAKALRVINGSF